MFLGNYKICLYSLSNLENNKFKLQTLIFLSNYNKNGGDFYYTESTRERCKILGTNNTLRRWGLERGKNAAERRGVGGWNVPFSLGGWQWQRRGGRDTDTDRGFDVLGLRVIGPRDRRRQIHGRLFPLVTWPSFDYPLTNPLLCFVTSAPPPPPPFSPPVLEYKFHCPQQHQVLNLQIGEPY